MRSRLGDEPVVVRRDADVGAGVEQQVERGHEALAHLLEALVGDLRRLDVDALAEPQVESQAGERPDVVVRPP